MAQKTGLPGSPSSSCTASPQPPGFGKGNTLGTSHLCRSPPPWEINSRGHCSGGRRSISHRLRFSQLRRGPPGSLGLHVQHGTPGSPWQGLTFQSSTQLSWLPSSSSWSQRPLRNSSLWWPRLPAFQRPDAAVPNPCSLRSQSSRNWRVDRLLGFHPVSQGSAPL